MDNNLTLTTQWDKTFSRDERVAHKKVTFTNHFGITLVADLYAPKGEHEKLPALAISGPFGAVKEQAAGLYAQTLATKGFLTIAFDPSYTGESGGFPRNVNSPDINTEDFQAAVDYLVTHPQVNADQVGIVGICGWGGFALNVAALDPRIKATVAVTMYDLSRVAANGYFDENDSKAARDQMRHQMAAQRTTDFQTGVAKRAGGVVDPVPADAPQFVKDYHAYYKTKRGYHRRSVNSNDGWNMTAGTSLFNTRLLAYASEIENPVLIVHGDKAHSYYMGKTAFEQLRGDNKEMLTVSGANHVDLYDNVAKIPFERIAAFLKKAVVK